MQKEQYCHRSRTAERGWLRTTVRHSRPERNYCATHKELLAIVQAVRHFHVYLRTDHAPLQWLLWLRYPEGQIACWLQQVQEYDFTIEHQSGLKHMNVDALSQRPYVV